MEHFTSEQWIDFVNHVVSDGTKRKMAAHLTKGCKRCEAEVSLWQRVRSTAESASKYEAPESAVRIAKAAFPGASPGREQLLRRPIEVLFDSFLRPVMEGARASGESKARQMLYRAEPYQIDLSIEPKSEGNRIVVTGQLLDTRHPDAPGRGVPIMISNLRGNVVQTVTNEFGEFREEIPASSDMELRITGDNDKAVIISLRDVLGRFPDKGH